jgi:gliding motility-associated-like protein
LHNQINSLIFKVSLTLRIMKNLLFITFLSFISFSSNATCATEISAGCANGGYEWCYTVNNGGSISFNTLLPAGNWFISINGSGYTALSTGTYTNTSGATVNVCVLGVDPQPAVFGITSPNAAECSWTYTDCATSSTANVTGGHDCLLDACPNCGTPPPPGGGCATETSSGCGNGGYEWCYAIDDGADIVFNTLLPAGSWYISINGGTYNPLSAGTYTNSSGAVQNICILGVDPQPAVFGITAPNAAECSWTYTDCATSSTANVTGGHDCILDACPNCGTPPTSGPTADFSASLTTICEGDCIDFTDLSTSTATGGITTFSWTFTGSSTATSSATNPTNICYPTAGTYDVSLTVTDADGSDTETKTGYITVNAAPNAGSDNSSPLCDNATIDLNTLLGGGADPGGTWAETTMPASGQFNAGTGVFDGNGLAAGAYTFTYTVTGTAPCADDDALFTINVVDCSQPTAAFTTAQTTICVNDCIDFTDQSVSGTGITNWDWTFSGALTPTSNAQNPTNICYDTPGSYDVSLTVTDANGNDTETQVGYITVVSAPNAGSDESANLCNNQTLDLNTVLNGADPGGTWAETSGTPSGQFTPGTGVLDGNGLTGGSIYTFSYTVSNGTCADDVATITITIDDCNTPVAGFSASTLVICEGECIDFTSTSTSVASGGITNWDWTFNGSGTANSTLENPNNICYSTAGTYTVSLTVTDANGNDTHTETNYITVQACQTPVAAFAFDTAICVGDCINFIDQSTGNPTSWGWQFGGASPSTSSQQNPTNICFISPGVWTISLTATNASGSSTTTQDITVYPEPFVIANPDQTIIIGTNASLSATGDPGDFYWSPIDDVDCPTCQFTTADPIQSTTYYVTLTDTNGCSATDSTVVFVEVVEAVGVPTAFSPNGNGNNDILFVEGSGIETMTFQVFNRYGQKVFETDNMDQGWDGTLNGKELNPGVFTYVLRYKYYAKETQMLTGTITLIK